MDLIRIFSAQFTKLSMTPWLICYQAEFSQEMLALTRILLLAAIEMRVNAGRNVETLLTASSSERRRLRYDVSGFWDKKRQKQEGSPVIYLYQVVLYWKLESKLESCWTYDIYIIYRQRSISRRSNTLENHILHKKWEIIYNKIFSKILIEGKNFFFDENSFNEKYFFMNILRYLRLITWMMTE